MSRIGKKPVVLPDKVEITRSGDLLNVRGPKGEIPVRLPDGVVVEVGEGAVNVKASGDEKGLVKALHGLVRMLIANSVQGVTEGFSRTLEIVGTGYKAEMSGNGALKMSLGYSHPVTFSLPEGVTARLEARGTRLTLEGIDKQAVGLAAAKIRNLRPPDSYKGKGVRFSGEAIKLKPGKSGAKK